MLSHENKRRRQTLAEKETHGIYFDISLAACGRRGKNDGAPARDRQVRTTLSKILLRLVCPFMLGHIALFTKLR
ncbi:MAG: hypothetical protein Q4C86_13765 [bacterium]|nr:hypothetical protein [bacterium]